MDWTSVVQPAAHGPHAARGLAVLLCISIGAAPGPQPLRPTSKKGWITLDWTQANR